MASWMDAVGRPPQGRRDDVPGALSSSAIPSPASLNKDHEEAQVKGFRHDALTGRALEYFGESGYRSETIDGS